MLPIRRGTKMEPLGACTKFAMVIAVISVISLCITPVGREGFYLSLLCLGISVIIAISGFLIMHKRAKKKQEEEKQDEKTK